MVKKYFLYAKKELVFTILCKILAVISVATIPMIIMNLLDNFHNIVEARTFGIYLLIFIGNIILLLTFDFLNKLFSAKFEYKINMNLKQDIFNNILNKDPTSFYSKDTNFYVSTLVEDVKNLYSDYFYQVLDIFLNLVTAIVFIIYMGNLNIPMTIAVVIASLVSLFIPKIVGKKMDSKQNAKIEADAYYIRKINNLFSGFLLKNERTKKAYIEEHSNANENKEKKIFQFRKYTYFVRIFAGISYYFVLIVSFIFGAFLVMNETISIAHFFAIWYFVDFVSLPFRSISYNIISMKSSKAILEKIKLDFINEGSTKNIDINFSQAIELKDINYEIGNFKLENINAIFSKGKKYAIIGKSGSGKSTILKLISQQLIPQTGHVLFDDINAQKINVYNLVSEISQNIFIFNSSPIDNITLFGTYDIEYIKDYLNLYNIENILNRKDFNENGQDLSGGEKNKIAILRAICRNCPILLCDEMYSGLDENSKEEIEEILWKRKDTTIISVTHDITIENLKKYDYVYVVSEGKIVDFLETNLDSDELGKWL